LLALSLAASEYRQHLYNQTHVSVSTTRQFVICSGYISYIIYFGLNRGDYKLLLQISRSIRRTEIGHEKSALFYSHKYNLNRTETNTLQKVKFMFKWDSVEVNGE